jgi:hypothetical protein
MTPAQIGITGEQYVVADPTSKGFSCYRNTQLPGATDVEAVLKDIHGNITRKLLVQVKTAVPPNSPDTLSAEEAKAIVARARRGNSEAYLAQVLIDDIGRLLKITYSQLA